MAHRYQAFYRAVSVWFLLGLALGFSFAEANSKLTGTVIDPSDRPVPGAEILLRNAATLVEQTVTTNNEGIY